MIVVCDKPDDDNKVATIYGVVEYLKGKWFDTSDGIGGRFTDETDAKMLADNMTALGLTPKIIK